MNVQTVVMGRNCDLIPVRIILTLVAASSALGGCVTKDVTETCEFPDNSLIVAAPEDVRVWVWAPKEWLKETPFLRMSIESPKGTTETFEPRLARTQDMAAPSSSMKCSETGELLMFEDSASALGMSKLFEATDTVRKFSFSIELCTRGLSVQLLGLCSPSSFGMRSSGR